MNIIRLYANDPKQLQQASQLQEGMRTGRHSDIDGIELVVPARMLPNRMDNDDGFMNSRPSTIGRMTKETVEQITIGHFADVAQRDDRFRIDILP